MLGGETPYHILESDSEEDILKKLNTDDLQLSGGNWAFVSDLAKDLLKKMLSFDVSKRPTAKHGLYFFRSKRLLFKIKTFSTSK